MHNFHAALELAVLLALPPNAPHNRAAAAPSTILLNKMLPTGPCSTRSGSLLSQPMAACPAARAWLSAPPAGAAGSPSRHSPTRQGRPCQALRCAAAPGPSPPSCLRTPGLSQHAPRRTHAWQGHGRRGTAAKASGRGLHGLHGISACQAQAPVVGARPVLCAAAGSGSRGITQVPT